MQPTAPNTQDQIPPHEPLESEPEETKDLVEFEGGGERAVVRHPGGVFRFVAVPLIAALLIHAVAFAAVVWWVSSLRMPQFARAMGSNNSADSPSTSLHSQEASPAARASEPIPPSLADALDPPRATPREDEKTSPPPVIPDKPIHLEPREEGDSPPIIGVGAPMMTPRFHRSAPANAAPATASYQNAGQAAPPKNAQFASSAATAPRVAQAGRHGNEDGFDQRGLPLPEYPAESRLRREQGLVQVDVEVLPDGSVGDIKLIEDAGYPRLGRSAIEAMHRARRFDPATVGGAAVTGHLIIQFQFVLQ